MGPRQEQTPALRRGAAQGIAGLLMAAALSTALAPAAAAAEGVRRDSPAGDPSCQDRKEQLMVEAARLASERKMKNVDVLLAGVVVGAVGLAVFELAAVEQAALYDRYRQRDANGLITGIRYAEAQANASRIGTQQAIGVAVGTAGAVIVGTALTLLLFDSQRPRPSTAGAVSWHGTSLAVAF